ncbi:flagellinolysin [Vogesella indigofera]|uniref:flagellinolysin n=1 Tax=Vogesella indigofera TaxID=45465 RepID=UPI00234CCC71|nr:flagellinolysin [Vogesella indigofera]MDC7703237.1 flagellinolysin [Vogesella indigofera]
MQINTNTLAMHAQRQLEKSSNSLTRTLARLSSGLRINSAMDDAAGQASASRMDAKIRGERQGLRNVTDNASMLQVTEGALAKVSDMLQRMRELSVQAANGTLSSPDRQALQAEANQLLQGIDQIGRETEFNGQQVFSQSTTSLGGDADKRAVMDGLQLGWLEASERRIKQFYGIQGDGATMTVNLNPGTPGGTLASVSYTGTDGGGRMLGVALNVEMADFTPANLPNGGSAPFYNDRVIAHEMVHAVMGRSMNITTLPTWFMEGTAEFIHGADERLAGDVAAAGGAAALVGGNNLGGAWASDSAHYSAAYAATRYLHQQVKQAGGSGIKDVMQALNGGATLDAAINSATKGNLATSAAFIASWNTNGAAFIGGMDLSNADTGAVGGADADGGTILTAETALDDNNASLSGANVLQGFKLDFPDIAGATGQNFFTVQSGSNAGDTLQGSVGAVNVASLGLQDLDLDKLAKFAIFHLDQALDYVSQERAKIGGMMSRLDSASQNLQSSTENASTARSRILDADYAQETANQTRQSVLQQAGTAMLAQANSQSQNVLRLLQV